MKRLTYIFTLIALMLGMTGSVQAQQEWDFTKSYEEDLTALSAATTEWSYASDKNRYDSKNAIDGAITAGGTELTLTSKEYAILQLLLSHPDKIFSRSNIFDSLWGDDSGNYDDNAVKVHMSNLRSKLSAQDTEEYIETVWGMGYRLAN